MALTKINKDMLHSAAQSVLIQQVYSETKTHSAGNSAQIPYDDTIPTSSEGTEILTATITPTSASSYLLVSGQIVCAGSASPSRMHVALFRDSGTDAIYATSCSSESNNKLMTIPFRFRVPAGSTAATTFKLRAAVDSGNLSVNGTSGGRIFGGAAVTCIQIDEIKG